MALNDHWMASYRQAVLVLEVEADAALKRAFADPAASRNRVDILNALNALETLRRNHPELVEG